MPMEKLPDDIEKTANIETLPSEKESQKIESVPNVSQFAEEKISDLDAKQNEIQNSGDGEAKRIEKEYQPSTGLSEKYKTLFDGFAARSRKIVDKAKIGIKETAKGVIIGSMLAATAGIAEGNVLEKPSGKTQEGIKIEKNESQEKRGSVELQTEGNPEEKKEKNNETREFIKTIKEYLTKQISGKDFLKKLTVEFNGDKQKATEEQAKRIENIKNVNVVVIENELEFRKKIEELKNKGLKFNGESEKFKGVYSDNDHTVYSQRDFPILAHELVHSETRGTKDITENAKKILDDSYLKQGFLNIFSGKDDKYLSHSAERLVGKKDLDFVLEILDIKKYGEPFTEEHYDKMMKAYEEGKIKGNAGIFIERTKKEYFKKIFDEIAKNENPNETIAA